MNKIFFQSGQTYTPSKIVCVGQNYAKHIEEMKSRPAKNPVLFLKPNSALHPITEPLIIPGGYGAVHHEIELAVCIGQAASNVSLEQAAECIAGYGVALDLTLRDMQSAAKEAGLPWATAKGFDKACPISTFVQTTDIEDPQNLNLILKVNGQLRQNGNTSHMLRQIPELISYASRFYSFEAGDIFLTGTPAGVGPLQSGDEIEASIEKIGTFKTKVK